MCKELINQVKTCMRCRKYEASPDKADLQKIVASAPGEILHIGYTSIEELVDLQTQPVIRNVLVLQDHFSFIVAYVVDDKTAETARLGMDLGQVLRPVRIRGPNPTSLSWRPTKIGLQMWWRWMRGEWTQPASCCKRPAAWTEYPVHCCMTGSKLLTLVRTRPIIK